jgi:hypothetical protein
MDKDYSVFDLISLWEKDIKTFDKIEESNINLPSKKAITNILSYANCLNIYSTTFKNKIELCLN